MYHPKVDAITYHKMKHSTFAHGEWKVCKMSPNFRSQIRKSVQKLLRKKYSFFLESFTCIHCEAPPQKYSRSCLDRRKKSLLVPSSFGLLLFYFQHRRVAGISHPKEGLNTVRLINFTSYFGIALAE